MATQEVAQSVPDLPPARSRYAFPLADPAFWVAQEAMWNAADAEQDAAPKQGCVYFVGPKNGPIKIGYSTDVQRRLARLQSHSPVRLAVLAVLVGGTVEVERGYHARFSRHRLHGEWFAPNCEIIAEIKVLNLSAG